MTDLIYTCGFCGVKMNHKDLNFHRHSKLYYKAWSIRFKVKYRLIPSLVHIKRGIQHRLRGHIWFYKPNDDRVCLYCGHKQECLGVNPLFSSGWIG